MFLFEKKKKKKLPYLELCKYRIQRKAAKKNLLFCFFSWFQVLSKFIKMTVTVCENLAYFTLFFYKIYNIYNLSTTIFYIITIRAPIKEVKQMGQHKIKPTKWHMRPAKTQINLVIRPVWAESLLSTWRKLESLATHWVLSKNGMWRLRSAWASAQADLSLHMPFCRLLSRTGSICIETNIQNVLNRGWMKVLNRKNLIK